MPSPASSARPATPPPRIVPGKKYRFVVKSAEEAVSVIQERMGPKAEVVSVNQVGGQGLGKFLQSPKLEIVATIPAAEADAVEAAAPEGAPPPHAAPTAPKGLDEAHTPAPGDGPAGEEHGPYRGPPAGSVGFSSLLEKMGFDATLLVSLEKDPRWKQLEAQPLSVALEGLGGLLREEYARLSAPPVTDRIAFIGTPGSGKTTALCKRLTQDVFVEQRQPVVVRLEGEHPNPNDALQSFCDVLQVPLLREPLERASIATEALVYVDVPGIVLQDAQAWQQLEQRLHALWITTRVAVFNAAYELTLLKQGITALSRHGATHLVFTHLDEIQHPARLWQPLLRGGLSPWFLTHGQSVTEDLRSDIFTTLLEYTFPRPSFS